MTLRFRMMLLACLAAGSTSAENDFSRYEVILNRKPFGLDAAPPVAPAVPPGESVVNKVKMTAVVRDEAGVLRVGIVDLTDNRNYLLGIGDRLGALEVVEADYELERARLRRGPEDYWVSMFGGSNRFEAVSGEPAPGTGGVTSAPGAPSAPALRSARREERDQRLSYALRRLQREAARRRAAEAERGANDERAPHGTSAVVRAGQTGPGGAGAGAEDAEVLRVMESLNAQEELSPEEIAQLLQEYQKTLIRSGQTPLPIALTPETDAQLVEEGFLPPP